MKPLYKIIALTLFLAISFMCCKSTENKINTLEVAKKYYTFLDESDASKMVAILSDSIVIRENKADYEERFSKAGYLEWLKWDAVFEPSYKVLELKQEGKIVKAKISKIDKRLLFLHGEPMIWYETILFDEHKIKKVERTTYEVFNVDKFIKNRTKLTNWIDEKHPELNGFLHDQTIVGGIKYLKAIELYSNKE